MAHFSIQFRRPDGTPDEAAEAEVERLLALADAERDARSSAENARRERWAKVLWKGGRVEYWITALLSEGVESLAGVTWALILRLERSKKYEQLGRRGGNKLAEIAGLGPRPVWTPGRYEPRG